MGTNTGLFGRKRWDWLQILQTQSLWFFVFFFNGRPYLHFKKCGTCHQSELWGGRFPIRMNALPESTIELQKILFRAHDTIHHGTENGEGRVNLLVNFICHKRQDALLQIINLFYPPPHKKK